MLSEWQLIFKSECFSHENEVRAILYISTEIPKEAVGISNFKKGYLTKEGYIIPYIELSSRLAGYLELVTIGPLAEQEISQATVKSLLSQRGYEAEIISSQIPIRF